MSWTDEVPALGHLAPASRARLGALSPMSVDAGAVLFRPGDTVQGYVIVLEGRIGVYLIGTTGREILLYDVAPGTSCIQSTLGLLGGDDYSGEAVAELPSRLVLVPRPVFLDLLDRDAGFRALVFTAFAKRMQSMMQVVEKVAFQKIETRLAAYLLSAADTSGQVAATQQEIASAIGSAREVVSRRLTQFADRGLIRPERGAVRIVDPDGLSRMIDAGT